MYLKDRTTEPGRIEPGKHHDDVYYSLPGGMPGHLGQ